jgi:acyl carrier protein
MNLNEFIAEFTEFAELEESYPGNENLSDFDEWDSLTSLSLIAMVDSDYEITLTNKIIEGFETVAAFCDYIISHEK